MTKGPSGPTTIVPTDYGPKSTLTGTGDLCASLLLAWLHKYVHAMPCSALVAMTRTRTSSRARLQTCTTRMPNDLQGVLERVIATVQATLRRTHDEAGPGAELRLIQSKEDIERWVDSMDLGELRPCSPPTRAMLLCLA